MAIAEKKLPKNIEAEKAVLGGMLTSSTCCSDALGALQVDDFFDSKNRNVFETMLTLETKHLPIDPQTVGEELINLKYSENVGGLDYLIELSQSIISYENFDTYIAIVKDNAVLRRLLNYLGETEKTYLTEEIDNLSDFVAKVQSDVNKIADKRRISTFISSSELAEAVKKKIYELVETHREGTLTGVDTGYDKLNDITNGLQPGNLIIMAARPAVGKTALALNIAFNAASRTGRPVAIFSLEMTAESLYTRMISARSLVDLNSIGKGIMNNQQKLNIGEAADTLGSLQIYVDPTSGLSILDLMAKAKKLKAQKPDLALVVIDYIGLITTNNSGKKFDSRQNEVSEISRSLKQLAKELQVPVLCLCQLSRKVEEMGREPKLIDLRESGSIEQDADVVLMLHRHDYQKGDPNAKGNQGAEPSLGTIQDKAAKETFGMDASAIDIIVAKNRSGRSDYKIPLIFCKNISRFDNPSEDFSNKVESFKNGNF